MKANSAGEPEWAGHYSPAGYISYLSSPSSVRQTSDGGYVLAGAAYSLSNFHGWVLKLDHEGSVQWSKTYGGPGSDYFSTKSQTKDGGYILTGNTESFGSSFHSSNGRVLRLDSAGDITWQEAFEGQDIYWAEPTSDNGIILAGTVCVFGSTVQVAGAWVFKLDTNGNTVWQKAFEATANNQAHSLKETSDGGYVVAAHSTLGAWILRLDPNGNLLWQKSYSEGYGTIAISTSEASDKGFLIAGGAAQGPWILKLDVKGNMVWQKTYGGPGSDSANVISESGGGYLLKGTTDSFGAGGRDVWIARLDASGDFIWQRTYIQNCSLVVPSNGVLTEPVTITTNTAITSVNTNAVVVSTSVNGTSAVMSVTTQCMAQGDRDKG